MFKKFITFSFLIFLGSSNLNAAITVVGTIFAYFSIVILSFEIGRAHV